MTPREHAWSGEICQQCWCDRSWPLAAQSCPFPKSAEDRKVRGSGDTDDEGRRRRAADAQRERRAQLDPELTKARNREYKRRQREREKRGEQGMRRAS